MKYFCLIVLLFIIVAETVSARPARVILIRHAEKPPDESNVHLSERGQARARSLAILFATERVLGTNGPPAALFAPKITKRGHTLRPYETLEPVAKRLKLSIQTPYGSDDYAAFA